MTQQEDKGVSLIGGEAVQDGRVVPTGLSQAEPSGLGPSGFDPSRVKPCFEARQSLAMPWVWEVWDIEHPAPGNHFPVITVDSRGASDDFHEAYARICVDALNGRYAAEAHAYRQREAEFFRDEAAFLRDSDGSPKGGDACGSVHDSAGPKDIAQPPIAQTSGESKQ